MNTEIAINVLEALGVKDAEASPIHNGLINRTWQVRAPGATFILQRINDSVFQQPQAIATNIRLMGGYLQTHHPDYLFVKPVATTDGADLLFVEGEGWFRLFPFIPGSHTIDVVQTPEQAYEAAKQFGRFTWVLSDFDVSRLQTTIPHFHNLPLRYGQFLNAINGANAERKLEAQPVIETLWKQKGIVAGYERMLKNPAFKLRVTHHDTKISNVLFDENGKGLCVIDLDTVMPGYFLSDVGDMVRTYLSPVSEEESDSEKIEVREAFYKAIVDGYCSEMSGELSVAEKAAFSFAGKFMVYMQALRFLTDYLNNDVYYGAKYKEHNLIRARNQTVLLERLTEMENKQATALQHFL